MSKVNLRRTSQGAEQVQLTTKLTAILNTVTLITTNTNYDLLRYFSPTP